MKTGSFYLQMYALVAQLIPDIEDEYRAEGCEDSDEPSMTLTIGLNRKGWSYQTGDNSFTGGAYGYADWAVVTLDRECNPDDVAEDIIAQCADFETDVFEALPERNAMLIEVRDAIRHPFTSVGGYPVYCVMNDGGRLCRECARKEYRELSCNTRQGNDGDSGWVVAGVEVFWEGTDECCNCNAPMQSAYGPVEGEE